MPADEVTHGTDVDASRVRTGPRHAAPRKPLFTRFHMPAGKAIALAAMPTAVLMGMGFTSTFANADDQPASNSQQADEYKDCVTALDPSASATPSPSASASDEASDSADQDDTAEPTPSATSSSPASDTGKDSSSDSGSDDKADPTPSASESKSSSSGSGDTATPTPSASESKNVLETIGDTIGDILTGGDKSATESASASPTPSASASASESAGKDESTDSSDAVKETTKKVTDTVEDTVKDATDTASKAAEDTTKAVEEAAEDATSSPSPSASSTTDADDCEAATDAEGGVDNKVLLPDNPWTLNASSLTLKGADYKGIVKVRTASGKVKEVLKYVISGGTDIGDLHQTVKDEQSGKTYHVQAATGLPHSTIEGGDTIMYTESISGNLFGLIPVTFSPKSPPPLNIPYIYFSNAKVQQAGQFGGTLTIPGLHQYID
ncbi:hypothetical protein OG985_16295 [Streptomyces sp. NBC_00289]|uniref:hypothetical protein n=1 Tax=Streptomyces sp. NBC_00289 TaxID=2975703 RepID=UPI00324A051C